MSKLLAAINHAIVQEHFTASRIAELTGTKMRSYNDATDQLELDSLSSRIYFRGPQYRAREHGAFKQADVTTAACAAFNSIVERFTNINTMHWHDFSVHPVHFNVIQEHAYEPRDDVYLFTMVLDFLKAAK